MTCERAAYLVPRGANRGYCGLVILRGPIAPEPLGGGHLAQFGPASDIRNRKRSASERAVRGVRPQAWRHDDRVVRRVDREEASVEQTVDVYPEEKPLPTLVGPMLGERPQVGGLQDLLGARGQ